MTTQQIIALAKEKFGRDVTDKEAQDYLNGKAALPDEALSVVSGGSCTQSICPYCGSTDIRNDHFLNIHCGTCGRPIRLSELKEVEK